MNFRRIIKWLAIIGCCLIIMSPGGVWWSNGLLLALILFVISRPRQLRNPNMVPLEMHYKHIMELLDTDKSILEAIIRLQEDVKAQHGILVNHKECIETMDGVIGSQGNVIMGMQFGAQSEENRS